MNKKYRLIAVLTITGVLALGVVIGGVGERLIAHKTSHRPEPPGPTQEVMARELGLTLEQQAAIKEVFKRGDERFGVLRSELHKTMREMREQLQNEIDQVLTAEQRAKMKEMIKAYEAKNPRKKPKSQKNEKETRGETDKSSSERTK